ncbi:MAG: nickel-dependent lactate racemase [Planctomycetaceae bacterium]|nr:nickel-dependent lactate racemase [Planctomycetaceae bacterium]
MKYELAYGKKKLAIELPENNVVKVLNIKSAPPLEEPAEDVRQKLLHPNGTLPLFEIAAGKQTACIVICDITRPVPNKIILPPMLETLENAGIKPKDITILVGTGLHRASFPEEKDEMLGVDIRSRYNVEDHIAKDISQHTYLGDSTGGVPIWIDSRYMEADVKILTGLIEPHFMAGFSGGRKSICPAIAAAETILAWHSPRFLEHENAKFGCLENNPVHTEIIEIAKKAGCDFIVNVVIDHERKILKTVAGEMEAAHLEGVEFARQIVTDTVKESVDIVITSSAGYPLDKTWYQSIKGIVGALDILKEGGIIILAAACDEGFGSKEFEIIAERFSTIDDFMKAICSGAFQSVDQWQVEELAKALRKGRVIVVSDGLRPEQFERFYVKHSPTVEEAVAAALKELGTDAKIAVMPDGPYVMAEVD